MCTGSYTFVRSHSNNKSYPLADWGFPILTAISATGSVYAMSMIGNDQIPFVSILLGLGQAADATRIDIPTPVVVESIACSNQWVAFIGVDQAKFTWFLALYSVLHTALSTTLGPNVTISFPPSHRTAYTSLPTSIALVADRYLVVGMSESLSPYNIWIWRLDSGVPDLHTLRYATVPGSVTSISPQLLKGSRISIISGASIASAFQLEDMF